MSEVSNTTSSPVKILIQATVLVPSDDVPPLAEVVNGLRGALADLGYVVVNCDGDLVGKAE